MNWYGPPAVLLLYTSKPVSPAPCVQFSVMLLCEAGTAVRLVAATGLGVPFASTTLYTGENSVPQPYCSSYLAMYSPTGASYVCRVSTNTESLARYHW